MALLSPDMVGTGSRREGGASCVSHPPPLPEVETPVADAGPFLMVCSL